MPLQCDQGLFVGGAALAELFHATRRRFVHDVSDVAIASQGYRLRRLQRMSERAEHKGDFKLAAALLDQVAREMGGHYVKARPGLAPDALMGAAEAKSRLVAYCDAEVERRLAARDAAAEDADAADGPGDAPLSGEAREKAPAESWPSEAAARAYAAGAALESDGQRRALPFGNPYPDARIEDRPAPPEHSEEEQQLPTASCKEWHAADAQRNYVTGIID